MTSLSSIRGETTRGKLASIFEQVIAEESRLAAATRRYVWQVRASPVQSLKRLFAEQGRQIDRWLGELGEQARGFGLAFGAAREERSGHGSEDADAPMPRAVLQELLGRHERMAHLLRTDVTELETRDGNQNVTNVLTGLLEFHETTAWMLRLLLDAPGTVV